MTSKEGVNSQLAAECGNSQVTLSVLYYTNARSFDMIGTMSDEDYRSGMIFLAIDFFTQTLVSVVTWATLRRNLPPGYDLFQASLGAMWY